MQHSIVQHLSQPATTKPTPHPCTSGQVEALTLEATSPHLRRDSGAASPADSSFASAALPAPSVVGVRPWFWDVLWHSSGSPGRRAAGGTRSSNAAPSGGGDPGGAVRGEGAAATIIVHAEPDHAQELAEVGGHTYAQASPGPGGLRRGGSCGKPDGRGVRIAAEGGEEEGCGREPGSGGGASAFIAAHDAAATAGVGLSSLGREAACTAAREAAGSSARRGSGGGGGGVGAGAGNSGGGANGAGEVDAADAPRAAHAVAAKTFSALVRKYAQLTEEEQALQLKQASRIGKAIFENARRDPRKPGVTLADFEASLQGPSAGLRTAATEHRPRLCARGVAHSRGLRLMALTSATPCMPGCLPGTGVLPGQGDEQR